MVKIYRFWEFLDRTERHTNYPNVVRTIALLHYLFAIFHWNACLVYVVQDSITSTNLDNNPSQTNLPHHPHPNHLAFQPSPTNTHDHLQTNDLSKNQSRFNNPPIGFSSLLNKSLASNKAANKSDKANFIHSHPESSDKHHRVAREASLHDAVTPDKHLYLMHERHILQRRNLSGDFGAKKHLKLLSNKKQLQVEPFEYDESMAGDSALKPHQSLFLQQQSNNLDLNRQKVRFKKTIKQNQFESPQTDTHTEFTTSSFPASFHSGLPSLINSSVVRSEYFENIFVTTPSKSPTTFRQPPKKSAKKPMETHKTTKTPSSSIFSATTKKHITTSTNKYLISSIAENYNNKVPNGSKILPSNASATSKVPKKGTTQDTNETSNKAHLTKKQTKKQDEEKDIFAVYLKSLYHSTMVLTTVGNLPEPTTKFGFAFAIFEFVFALLLFAAILGHVANIVTSISAARKEFQGTRVDCFSMHRIACVYLRRLIHFYSFLQKKYSLHNSSFFKLKLFVVVMLLLFFVGIKVSLK